MQQVPAAHYVSFNDVSVSPTASASRANTADSASQIGGIAVPILSVNQQDRSSRKKPYKSTYMAVAISTVAVLASFAELVLASRKVVDHQGEESFNIAVQKVGYSFGLIISNIALGGLYRQKGTFFKTITCIAGIGTSVLSVHADNAGFTVGGPFTATAAVVWTFKAIKPIELIYSCFQKIFGG